jgi:hypothetical protein
MIQLRGSLFLIAAAALAAVSAGAQQSRYYKGQEWESLFNGKDLTGWKVIGQGKWIAQDGQIVGESVGNRGGFVVTERTFKQFEISLEFFPDTPGNSGLFYHTSFDANGKFQNGMQVEIDRTINRHSGGLHEPYGRNWVVWPAPENESVVRADAWNTMLVKVVANRVITRLNGVEMIDFTDPNPKNTDGVIGMQIHSGHPMKIRFKEIFIRDLAAR